MSRKEKVVSRQQADAIVAIHLLIVMVQIAIIGETSALQYFHPFPSFIGFHPSLARRSPVSANEWHIAVVCGSESLRPAVDRKFTIFTSHTGNINEDDVVTIREVRRLVYA